MSGKPGAGQLASLPEPREAAGVITALLADHTREDYFNALSESRDIPPATARAIAYNLVAHAPGGTTTGALERFAQTGAGSHDGVRAEYLPLYEHPIMPAEGRMLLDALGTYLFHQHHPAPATPPLAYALDGGLFYTEDHGERVAVAFQLPMGLAAEEVRPLGRFLERHLQRYGDPFRAYLRLPGVDATSPTLVVDYLSAHAIDEEADVLKGQSEIAWDAVEIGGRLHVFTR